MKLVLSMLLATCLIVAVPFFLRDRQGTPYLEELNTAVLLNYPAQFEAWQRIAERFIPPQYIGNEPAITPDTAPTTVHRWRDAQGITHFTEPGRESMPAGTKVKTLTIAPEYTFISQMPDARTTQLFTGTLWLALTLFWSGLFWVAEKIQALCTPSQEAPFSRFINMQTMNKKRAEENAWRKQDKT